MEVGGVGWGWGLVGGGGGGFSAPARFFFHGRYLCDKTTSALKFFLVLVIVKSLVLPGFLAQNFLWGAASPFLLLRGPHLLRASHACCLCVLPYESPALRRLSLCTAVETRARSCLFGAWCVLVAFSPALTFSRSLRRHDNCIASTCHP